MPLKGGSPIGPFLRNTSPTSMPMKGGSPFGPSLRNTSPNSFKRILTEEVEHWVMKVW